MVFAITGALALSACGGGGDDEDDATATPAATATPEILTPLQIVEKLEPSVVHIVANYPEGVGGGSGIVWGDSSHVLTNAHVVLGAGSIKVVDPESRREVPATVVALSQCDDVALLKVERGSFVPATIGDSDDVSAGEEVVALGFPSTFADPAADSLTVTRGIVSKTGDQYDGLQDLIQTDAAINPGNSGGPLVNLRGEVIGMNTLSSRSRQNINYAIAMNEAKFVADKLANGENLNHLGARLQQNYPGLDGELGVYLAYIDGIVVTGIDAGSPADEAGLVYTDLIYSLDSIAVDSVGDICDILRSRDSGDTLRVDITRTYNDASYEDLYATVTLD